MMNMPRVKKTDRDPDRPVRSKAEPKRKAGRCRPVDAHVNGRALSREGVVVQPKHRKLSWARSSTDRHRSEATLVGRVVKSLPQLLARHGGAWRVSTEVPAGRSVADIVCVVRASHEPARRGNPLTVLESVLAAVLRQDGPASEDVLGRRCGFRNGELRPSLLRRLESRGLVLRDERSGMLSAGAPWADVTVLLAIEAKLLRWREALAQAREYRKYADFAFVALPPRTAKLARANSAQFRTARVGLLTVVDGKLLVCIAPARSRIHDWRREFVLSRMVRLPRRSGRRQ